MVATPPLPAPVGAYLTQHPTFYVELPPPTAAELVAAAASTRVPWEVLANIKLLLPAAAVDNIIICGWEGVVEVLKEVEAMGMIMGRRISDIRAHTDDNVIVEDED